MDKEERLAQTKRLILKAIKAGNNEPQYIRDYLVRNNHYEREFIMGEALHQLRQEGKIAWNETIEGYKLTA